MAKVIKNTLSPIEKHWKQAEEKSKELIDGLLNGNLPIEYNPKSLDLEKSTDWRVIAREDIPSFYQDYDDPEELPNSEELAEQIAYHYTLTLIKRLLNDLSNYNCHDPAWFEQLLNNYENY